MGWKPQEDGLAQPHALCTPVPEAWGEGEHEDLFVGDVYSGAMRTLSAPCSSAICHDSRMRCAFPGENYVPMIVSWIWLGMKDKSHRILTEIIKKRKRKCRLHRMTPKELVRDKEINLVVQHEIYLTHFATFYEGDILTVYMWQFRQTFDYLLGLKKP